MQILTDAQINNVIVSLTLAMKHLKIPKRQMLEIVTTTRTYIERDGIVEDVCHECLGSGKNQRKEIQLFEGDSLMILPESKEFDFKCCDCGLIHTVKIHRKNGNILLQFNRQ